jgi:hypothetical protein
MTAKKFPKTSHEPSEHETVRLGAPLLRRVKLPPTTTPAGERTTLARKPSRLVLPPPEPPRLGGVHGRRGLGTPDARTEKNEPIRLLRNSSSTSKRPRPHAHGPKPVVASCRGPAR